MGKKLGYMRGEIRKGYVPILVGREDDVVEKMWLPTNLISHPSIVALLDSSAHEFGYTHHQGLLKITHHPHPFKTILNTISPQ
ncbi:hypothetical protein G4B88_007259 [Cannabis sativa]|uniref:Uncharacterized protein n=1 Tax=Cannabis sativa TaxID=3483 RepID=A0A7J6FRA2_CANSA|nr:hypothetical protein G4B88_007259 [Cannabis sativa]